MAKLSITLLTWPTEGEFGLDVVVLSMVNLPSRIAKEFCSGSTNVAKYSEENLPNGKHLQIELTFVVAT